MKTVNLRPSRTPVTINDLEQYLQWRRESGRSVSPPTQRLLERATKAVETVREQIPMRGNVRTDAEQTDGEAHQRLTVARRTVLPALRERALFSPVPFKLKEIALTAAAAKITGSGNCGEMTYAALIEAGTQLEENETLVGAFDTSAGHLFAHLNSSRADGTNRVVVVDPWANGPAVLQEDHACEQESVLDFPHVNISSASEAEMAKRLASELEVAHNQDFFSVAVMKTELKNLKNQGHVLADEHLYDEKNVTNLHGPVNRAES